MEILYLLVPLSVIGLLSVLGVFAWALWRGQFDGLDVEATRLLLDPDQARAAAAPKESGS